MILWDLKVQGNNCLNNDFNCKTGIRGRLNYCWLDCG